MGHTRWRVNLNGFESNLDSLGTFPESGLRLRTFTSFTEVVGTGGNLVSICVRKLTSAEDLVSTRSSKSMSGEGMVFTRVLGSSA